jgi:hypothetical protein
MQRTYLDGLEADENVPFKFDDGGADSGQAAGPAVRENVDAGVDVIDLTAFRADLEAMREKGGDQG